MSLYNLNFEETFCVWNNLFSDEELDMITDYCENLEKHIAQTGIENNVSENESIRKSKISWISRNEDTNWIFERFDAAVCKLNSKFFGFDIDPLSVLQYTIYEEGGGHYEWHWDCFHGNNLDNIAIWKQRKVSAVMQLSKEDDYTGGNLELNAGGSCITPNKQRGLLSVFPSFVLHKVHPVETGTRRTLVGWYTGPDWR